MKRKFNSYEFSQKVKSTEVNPFLHQVPNFYENYKAPIGIASSPLSQDSPEPVHNELAQVIDEKYSLTANQLASQSDAEIDLTPRSKISDPFGFNEGNTITYPKTTKNSSLGISFVKQLTDPLHLQLENRLLPHDFSPYKKRAQFVVDALASNVASWIANIQMEIVATSII